MSAGRDADRTRALNAPSAGGGDDEVLLQVSARTDKGLVRENNEDSFVVADLSAGAGIRSGETTAGVGCVGRKGVLLAVSDGMGGQEAGEVASRMAVETLHQALQAEWTERAERDAVAELRNDLRMAVDRANRCVLEHVQKNPAHSGMGATLTAAVVLGEKLVLAHVGDSRCYLLRAGYLKTLTTDQSLAEELVRRGVVERDSPAYVARKSVLTRVVGQSGPLVPDSEVVDLAQGDRVLLCSDGLYGPVDDEVIRDILSEATDPDSAAEELVAEAKRRGAPDNVTCVTGWLSGRGLPGAAELDAGGGTMSVRLDARLAAAAGEDTLALALGKRDVTEEFDPKKVMEDETLRGPIPAKPGEPGPAPAPAPAPASAPAKAESGTAPASTPGAAPATAAAPAPAATPQAAPAPPPAPAVAAPKPTRDDGPGAGKRFPVAVVVVVVVVVLAAAVAAYLSL